MGTSFKEILGDAYKDDLTPEQIEELVSAKYDELSKSYAKKDASFNKTSSELADLKRKQTEKLTSEEQAKAESDAQIEQLLARNRELERAVDIGKYTKEFLAQGYDEALATDTAEALADGNLDKVFTNQKKFNVAQQKSIEAKLIQATPQPTASQGTTTVSYEDFSKMKYSEQMKLKESDPTLFAEFVNK